MKSVLFFFLLLCTLMIGFVSWESKAANRVDKQVGLTRFDRPVVLQGVTLKSGEYLFVHDNLAMERGEACTFVYEGNVPVPNRLVASFHCVPVNRTKANRFTVRTVETSTGVTELLEFQFAGDTEGHAVPTSMQAYINLE